MKTKKYIIGLIIALLCICVGSFIYAYNTTTGYTGSQVDTFLQEIDDLDGVSGIVKCDGAGDFSAATAGTDYYAPGSTDVALADGGTGASLSDPNADRGLFWDDSAGAITWLTFGTGFSFSDTTLSVSLGTSIEEGELNFSDVTTANASTSAHGLLPKLSGSTSEFLRGDGAWATPSGSGDVTGPASSTDNAIARFDGTGGKTIQNSNVTIDDTGNLNLPSGAIYQINGSQISSSNLSDGSSLLKNVVEDTSPQLGGNLDSNNHNIYIGDGSYNFGHSPQLGVEGVLEVDGTLYADGGIQSGASATPDITGDDSDTSAESIDWKIYGNATDTGDGTEDVDLFFQVLVNGTLTTIMQLDADGNIEAASDFNLASGKKYKINGSQISASDLSNGTTGSGSVVLATSPTLTTPNIGAATGTSLALTGNLSGNVPVILDTDASVTLSASDCKGGMRINNDNDAIDYTLPAAAAGLSITFYSKYAATVTVDTYDDSDTIILDGTSLTAGNAIDSEGNAGDFISLLAIDDSTWITLGRSGTWSDGGAD